MLHQILTSNNSFLVQYVLKSLRGRVEMLTRNKIALRFLKSILSIPQCEDGFFENIMQELNQLLSTERKHSLLSDAIQNCGNKHRLMLCVRFLGIFKDDKPMLRESAATIISECLEALPQADADQAIKQSQFTFEDLYYLPFSNYFIKSFIASLGSVALDSLRDYTAKNLVKLCNHQKSSRIVEITFECLGTNFCDQALSGLFGAYLRESELLERSKLASGTCDPEEIMLPEELSKKELKLFRSVVCNQFGNFTLKALYKHTSAEFKTRYSKYIYRIRRFDNELFSHFYASHFFNYFKKLSKETQVLRVFEIANRERKHRRTFRLPY
eukprot:GABU01005156.1.p1 GENE.GABU01005156.1~~GABU01005156.1.p1  ORF type:complete len:359 (+),score=93.42 GABU01005156.1:98-1078(+)